MIYRSCCPICIGKKYKILESFNTSNRNFLEYLESKYKLGNFLQEKKYIYELRYCCSCGTRYQAYVLDKIDTEKFYSNNINPKKSLIKQFENFKKNFFIRKKTAKLIYKLLNKDPYSNYNVLEVGAGWGMFAYVSSKFKLNFTTLEISKERRDFHNLLDIKTVDSFETIRKKGYQFDMVYSNQVIEHISDLKNFIKNCNLTLKKGGYFIAEYPSFNNLIHYLFKKNYYFYDMKTQALEHLQLISDKGAKDIFECFDSFEYMEYFPIRKIGDRLRFLIHFFTPPKHRGKGFIIARKIK